jgi:SulP family sulfate permease
LREAGDAIQIYWLSGYIFFGSSERVFERIRSDIEAQAMQDVDYVILDFRLVSGVDASAIASFTKLRNFCDRQGTTLVYSALAPPIRSALELGGFFGGKSRHQAFADLDFALAWCEDQVLAAAKLDTGIGLASFEPWLQQQLGPRVRAADFMTYLERKDAEGPQVLYRQGEPADTVDFVAIGSLAIDIASQDGENLRVRRTNTHTVLGEMGFFRNAVRSATVSAYEPVTIFTLNRSSLERMRRERSDLASAFDDFIVRILADRVEIASRAVVALSV